MFTEGLSGKELDLFIQRRKVIEELDKSENVARAVASETLKVTRVVLLDFVRAIADTTTKITALIAIRYLALCNFMIAP